MHASTLSVTALLALAHQVAALGGLNVKNMCSYPVYIMSVSNTAGSPNAVSGNGGSWSEAWRTNADGGGISVYIADSESDLYTDHKTQFEYTYVPYDPSNKFSNSLWYDISNINGYPFEGKGLDVTPSASGCRTINCPSSGTCSDAYNKPDDNQATAECLPTTDANLVLCPGGSDSTGSSSQQQQPPPESSSQVEATPAPTETAAAVSIKQIEPAITQAPSAPPAVATTVNVMTTFVTQLVTLEADPNGAAFFEIEARDAAPAHEHEHRNAHRGNHARYHHHGEQK